MYVLHGNCIALRRTVKSDSIYGKTYVDVHVSKTDVNQIDMPVVKAGQNMQ